MPKEDHGPTIAQVVCGLAAVLPAAQEYLDRYWVGEIKRAASILGHGEFHAIPEIAQALVPARYVLRRQTCQMSYHVSNRYGSRVEFAASLRFTPLSQGITVLHARVLERACRIEVTVEAVAMQPDRT